MKPWLKIFPKSLGKTKIARTVLARGKGAIYNRHNSRNYRAIIHYVTYLKIIKSDETFLKNFKKGYAVMVKPNEYFTNQGNIQKEFQNSKLILGKNAFIYFESPDDWDKYKKKLSKFSQVYELQTGDSTEVPVDDQWGGEYAFNITNRNPQEISLICRAGDTLNDEQKKQKKKVDEIYNDFKTHFKKLDIKINQKKPDQKGLGNCDFDFATTEVLEKTLYQLSMMILKISGIKEEIEKRDASIKRSEIDEGEKSIIEYCVKNNLYDLKRLKSVGALNEKEVPVCPLCKEIIEPSSLFETKKQVEGREVVHNTQSEIVLMHIEALVPMKLNHRPYNLGWGHEHCNKIQGEHSIEKTLENLKRILRANNLTNQ